MTIKFIEKAIEDENTGADVKYHEITAVNIDYKNRYASVTVEHYVSKRARELGRLPVGQATVLSFTDIELTMAENPVEHFYHLLVRPTPTDYSEPEEKYDGWVNPYLLAEGTIKARG